MQLFLLSTRQRRREWHQFGFNIYFQAEYHDLRSEPRLWQMPVVVDVMGMSLEEQCRIFAVLTMPRHPPSALVVVEQADVAAQAFAVACPAVFGLLSWSLSQDILQAALHLAPYTTVVHPLWIGLSAFPSPMQDSDMYHILLAMQDAQTIDVVCRRTAFSPRTVYRKLARLRANLALPPGADRRLPPSLLANQVFQALAAFCLTVLPGQIDALRTCGSLLTGVPISSHDNAE